MRPTDLAAWKVEHRLLVRAHRDAKAAATEAGKARGKHRFDRRRVVWGFVWLAAFFGCIAGALVAASSHRYGDMAWVLGYALIPLLVSLGIFARFDKWMDDNEAGR